MFMRDGEIREKIHKDRGSGVGGRETQHRSS